MSERIIADKSGLHPFRDTSKGIIQREPIVTTGQLLTPAQKEHLSEFQGREDLFKHLASHHGLTFLEGQQQGIDPQVRERYQLERRNLTDTQTLKLRHLQEHFENLAEKELTSKQTKGVTSMERLPLKEQYAGTKSMERLP